MEQGFSSSGRMGPPGYGQPVGGMGYPPQGSPQGPPHGPPQGPPQFQGQQGQAIVVNQAQPQVVNVISGQTFGTDPVSITCQFCKNPVTTVVQKKCNCGTCCLCCISGILIFICVQSCRNKEIGCNDATHTCPSCGQVLGNYNSC